MKNYYYDQVNTTISQDLADLKSLRERLLEQEHYEFISKFDQLILDGQTLLAEKKHKGVLPEKEFQVFKTKKILIINILQNYK